jgi:Fic family protein
LLIDKGVLKLPLLYLSDYLERNRATYYEHLSAIRTNHAIEPWIEFFLEGLKQTANNAIEILQATQLLETELTQVITQHFNKKEKVALQLLQHLFKQPIIKVKDVEEVCQLSPKSAGALVNEMVGLNILQPLNQQQRNRLFVFKRYVGLWER